MTCEAYRELLEKELSGEITESERADLLAHEAACPACREEHAQYLQLDRDLSHLASSVPPMPEDFHRRYMEKISEESHPKGKLRLSLPRIGRALAAAACAIFLIGGTLMTRDTLHRRLRSSDYSLAQEAASGNGLRKTISAPAQETVMTFSTADAGAGVYEMAYMAEEAEMDTADEDDVYTGDDAESHIKLIRNASLTLSTTDFSQVLSSLQELCKTCNGYISWQSEYENYSGLKRANLTLRIPQEKYDDFLSRTQALAQVVRREETTEDRTASYRDTAARLESQKALLERLNALVSEAGDLKDLLELQSQISDTQYRIDSLTSQLKGTDDLVQYATFSITLEEATKQTEAANPSLTLGERLMRALQYGLENLGDFLSDMLLFLAATLPFLLPLALLVVIIVLWARRRASRRKD
ncbi:MAG: DUF4349 domain-containing protein [Clostridia bacterium]|nr:DUF4349 domain-containing protein [Clostridia bacterium]